MPDLDRRQFITGTAAALVILATPLRFTASLPGGWRLIDTKGLFGLPLTPNGGDIVVELDDGQQYVFPTVVGFTITHLAKRADKLALIDEDGRVVAVA